MAEQYTLIRYSEYSDAGAKIFDLHDDDPCKVTAIRGRGIPKVSWTQHKNPSGHGATAQHYQIHPRELFVSLLWQGDTLTEAEEKRLKIYDMFTPFSSHDVLYTNVEPGDDPRMVLRVTLESGNQRFLDVHLDGPLDIPMSAQNQFGEYGGEVTVKLIAPNPFWYGGLTETGYSNLAIGNTIQTISTGVSTFSWYSYPMIWITGATGEVTITTTVNSVSKFFVIKAIPSATEILVDFRPFHRGVFNLTTGGTAFDQIEENDSQVADMLEIYIPPKFLQTTGVNNTVTVATPSGTDGNTAAKIAFHAQYIGI